MKTRLSSSMDWVTFTCLFSSFRGPDHQRIAVGYLLNHIQHVNHFQTSRPVSARYGHCGRWVLGACSFLVGIFRSYRCPHQQYLLDNCVCNCLFYNGNIVHCGFMVLGSCLLLLHLLAPNVCQSLEATPKCPITLCAIPMEYSDSNRCKVGLNLIGYNCCQSVIVFVTDMIDS